MKTLILLFSVIGAFAWAQEEMGSEEAPAPASVASANDGMSEPVAESTRDPASESVPGRKANEEELRVRPSLPDAQVKKDTRSLQAEVYKSVYNKDLKPDQREDVLDE
jgi:hypothetical protein